MTMIEKVARALCEKWAYRKFDVSISAGQFIINKIEQEWKNFIPDAKAAILVMREPTEEMVEAGDHNNYNKSLAQWDTEGTYQSMIDAALKE